MAQQIEFYDELKLLLVNCQASDKAVRQQSEAQIRDLRDGNVKKFMASLIKEIGDASNSDAARQMASVICKNLIANTGADQRYIDLWIGLEMNFRTLAKEGILQNLASPSHLVRSQISNLIAAIAVIEIPRNEWLDLVPKLCQCAQGEENSKDVKSASLQTIGYICEELEPEDLTSEVRNFVMLALTNNINNQPANADLCKLAIKALQNCIPYVKQNFNVQQERDFIMQKILEAAQQTDSEIRENTLQCLVEIGSQEYEHVQHYFQAVAQLTTNVALNDEDKVGAQGIEFWTTLCEVELSRLEKNLPINNYIANSKDDLIQLLLQCISKVQIESEDDEDDEWGVTMSAGCCLQKVALLLKNDVMATVFAFVSQNVQSADWKMRYAALIALGAIIEGPERQQFKEILLPGLENLLKMFQDNSTKVREAISWVVSKICEHHADVVTSTPQATQYFVNILIQSLQDKPRVSQQCSSAIEKLATSLEPEENQQNNPLTNFLPGMVDALLVNSKRTDNDTNLNLVNGSLSAVTTLVQNCCSGNYQYLKEKLLLETLQLLEGTMNTPNQDIKKNSDFQDQLCGILQVITVKIGDMIEPELGENIIKLITMLFKASGKVTESGLIAYSGLCNGLGRRVNVDVIGEYLVYALEGEDEECTRIAGGIISDISSAYKEEVERFLTSFVPHLLAILKSKTRDRDTKICALQSLGDLSIHAPTSFCRNYLIATLDILKSAAAESEKVENYQNDPDTLEFLKLLRFNLIEAYTTLVCGVKESDMQQQFAAYMPAIFSFMKNSATIEKDQVIYVAIAGLIGDVVDCQQQQVAAFAQEAWVRDLLSHLQQAHGEAAETAQYAWGKIQGLSSFGNGVMTA